MPFFLTTHTLAAPLAPAGSVNIDYPSGTTRGHYLGSHGHLATIDGGTRYAPVDFDLVFNAPSVAFTWRGQRTLPAGTVIKLQLEIQGIVALEPHAVWAPVLMVRFGSPAAADADGVCAAQAVGGAGDATINGSLASGGVATMDVARGLVMASSVAGDTTQVVTVTGIDDRDQVVVEAATLTGTTAVRLQKAFKRVTRVHVSAAMTGNLTVGTSNLLGLPIYLPSAANVLAELVDNAAAGTAGTIKAGDGGPSSASSGDVRGTYEPNDAPNADRGYTLLMALPDADSIGPPQYAG